MLLIKSACAGSCKNRKPWALNHQNIAHIYEIGEADGVNFIAMGFIDGQTFREYIHCGKLIWEGSCDICSTFLHWNAKIYATLNEKELAFVVAGTWLSNGSDWILL